MAWVCCRALGDVADLLAYLAGDPEYELTLYGVRKTAEALERAVRRNEARLAQLVSESEAQCHTLEADVAALRQTAMESGNRALSAPGGLKAAAAQSHLAAARLALTELARKNSTLRREYIRLSAGRSALHAIQSRSALQRDRVLFDSILQSLREAHVPAEQLQYMHGAAESTVQQIAALEPQSRQYNSMLETLDTNLSPIGTKTANEYFPNLKLDDTDSLIAALRSLEGDSHNDAAALDALERLPLTPLTLERTQSTTTPTNSSSSGNSSTTAVAVANRK